MTALRQQMIEDMRIRGFSPTTIEQYVGRVSQLARYYGKSPDQLGPEEIRAYQVHLTENHVHWGTLQSTTWALQVAAMVQSRMLCRYGCRVWALLKQRLGNGLSGSPIHEVWRGGQVPTLPVRAASLAGSPLGRRNRLPGRRFFPAILSPNRPARPLQGHFGEFTEGNLDGASRARWELAGLVRLRFASSAYLMHGARAPSVPRYCISTRIC